MRIEIYFETMNLLLGPIKKQMLTSETDYNWRLPIHQGNSGISFHACLKMYTDFKILPWLLQTIAVNN